MHNHPKMVRAALDAGANGYVVKDSDPEVLVAALRRVAGGGHYLEPSLAEALLFARVPSLLTVTSRRASARSCGGWPEARAMARSRVRCS